MKIILRDATALDFEEIANISLEAYREYAEKLTVENWQKMAESICNVDQTASIADFIIAEVESEIAGAIAYYPLGKSNPKFFDSQWASLRLLAVFITN